MEIMQLYLSSNDATRVNNGNNADFEYILKNQLEIDDGNHIFISVNSVSIPYSFYNVNQYNNLLNISINGITYSYNLVNGNYTVLQLLSYLKSLLSTLTITYNSITNKFTFTSIYPIIILTSSTCYKLLGFKKYVGGTSSYINSIYTLTSFMPINLVYTNNITIASNFLTNNINSSIPNNNSILCTIPINTPPFSIIQYQNIGNFKINLFVNQISQINIKLLDDDENIIDLNGLDFNLTLQLEVINFRD